MQFIIKKYYITAFVLLALMLFWLGFMYFIPSEEGGSFENASIIQQREFFEFGALTIDDNQNYIITTERGQRLILPKLKSLDFSCVDKTVYINALLRKSLFHQNTFSASRIFAIQDVEERKKGDGKYCYINME